jgi:hypothetical protein
MTVLVPERSQNYDQTMAEEVSKCLVNPHNTKQKNGSQAAVESKIYQLFWKIPVGLEMPF